MAAQIPTQEGRIPFKVPARTELSCFTYYKVFGDLTGSSTPLVILHGGPGGGHEYLLPFAELWPQYGIPVIFYDQIGCGSSTRLPQTAGDQTFWKVALFIAELKNVLDYFNLGQSAEYHLLGHSWGGMLGADFATSQPLGLRGLVLASGLASQELSSEGLELCRQELPAEIVKLMKECEARKDFISPAYQEAMMIFYKMFLCRDDPWPPELLPALQHLSEDRTVQGTMNGPTPFVINGSTYHWTVIPRLSQITATTLVYNGEYDPSHDIATEPFFNLIPRVRWKTFSKGSHMVHLEGGGLRDQVFKIVGDFLKKAQVGDNTAVGMTSLRQ